MTERAPVRSNTLAAHYREQAEICLRMAEQALGPYDQEWRRIAAKWSKLARQGEAKSEPLKAVEVIESEIFSDKNPEGGSAEL